MIDPDALTAADRIIDVVENVLAGGQRVAGLRSESGLDLEDAVEGKTAGLIKRRLDIQPAIDDMGQETRVPDGLVLAAHDAEWRYATIITGHDAGNDGVHRALAALDSVGVIGLDPER